MPKDTISPKDIAKYFLIRAQEDGELISPLKIQKMVYFAYAAYLRSKKGKEKLFNEKIEAWPNGPVVPSLYRDLKVYGSGPIDPLKYADISVDKLKQDTPEEVIELLNGVYETCSQFTGFELTVATHQEKAWQEARKGLGATEPSNNPLRDDYILSANV